VFCNFLPAISQSALESMRATVRDLAHLLLDRLPEVLKQVKAIRDLKGLGRSLTGAVSIKARAVAVDDLDLRMTGKPLVTAAP
jgi:hypothetical protein